MFKVVLIGLWFLVPSVSFAATITWVQGYPNITQLGNPPVNTMDARVTVTGLGANDEVVIFFMRAGTKQWVAAPTSPGVPAGTYGGYIQGAGNYDVYGAIRDKTTLVTSVQTATIRITIP